MIRRIFAVIVIVGLAGSIGWTVWPSNVTQSAPTAAAVPPRPEQPVVATSPEPSALRTETVELRRRATLADVLMRSGLSAAEAHVLATSLREAGANLRRMRAGESVVGIAGGHSGTRAVAMSIFANHG